MGVTKLPTVTAVTWEDGEMIMRTPCCQQEARVKDHRFRVGAMAHCVGCAGQYNVVFLWSSGQEAQARWLPR